MMGMKHFGVSSLPPITATPQEDPPMSTVVNPLPIALENELRRHVVRHVDKTFDWDAFPSNRGFPELARAQMRYIGAGGSPKVGDAATLKPEHFTLSLIHKPVGNYAACHAHE